MRQFLTFLVLGFMLVAQPLAAQQIDVRSGEHEGFSRLVFMFPTGTGWSTERVTNGYRLTSTVRNGRFDLSSVFRFIPKTRILSVSAEMDANSVFIETAPETRLTSFQLPIGAVVIDIVDGAEPILPAPLPANGASFRLPQDSGYLGLYWSARQPVLSRIAGPSLPQRPANQVSGQISSLSMPDPRISSAELDLIDQMGRAASQGLISMQLPKLQNGAFKDGPDQEIPSHTADSEHSNHLALQSQTVIDRDTAANFSRNKLSLSGHSCPADSDFDLQAWLDDKPPGELISSARRDLLEEFDKPRKSAVEQLAKVYIALGFGAEAKAVLRAFGAESPDWHHLSIIADIVDGRPPKEGPDFSTMVSCNGKVAFWAFLAGPKPPSKEKVNFGAVTLAYAALPPAIRDLTGASLSARLIEIGAADVAAKVRATLARSPQEHRTALDMIDAQIDLSAGRTAEATARLEKVARMKTPGAAESLALAIETKLAHGQTIPIGEVQHAGALARELKGSEIAEKLHRAEVLGLASSADFESAFSAWDAWPTPSGPDIRGAALNGVFALMARVPDEQVFLRTYFQNRNRLNDITLSPEVQIGIADRLSQNGFARSARAILKPETRKTESGRLSLARAALADHDAAAAYSHLLGLTDDQAATLRGAALSLLGQHDTAKDEFARAGDREAQLNEAWRAGNWDLVARHGSDNQKRFLELFGEDKAVPATASPREFRGPLAQAQSLISRSETERTVYSQIMTDISAKQEGAADQP